MKFNEFCILNFFSLRAVYGTDDQKNALHGSDVFSAAEREIRFFFPDSKYLLFSRSQQNYWVYCDTVIHTD